MFLAVAELAVVVLVAWLFLTQIFVPLFRGTLLFPIFRREAKLSNELEKVRQRAVEKKLEEKIESTKKKEGM